MNYFLLVNSQQTGPFSESDIQAAIKGGSIAADTMVWPEGTPDWTTLGRLAEFADQFPPRLGVRPPPLPAAAKAGGDRRVLFVLLKIAGIGVILYGVFYAIENGVLNEVLVPGSCIAAGAALLSVEHRLFLRIPALFCFVVGLYYGFARFVLLGAFRDTPLTILDIAKAEVGPMIAVLVGLWIWDKGRVRKPVASP